MRLQEYRKLRERGAAAIELVVAAPLVLLLGAMCLDLASYLQYAMQVDAAATAGAKYVMNHVQKMPSKSDLVAYLNSTFPELGFDDGTATASIKKLDLDCDTYTYHLYRGTKSTSYDANSTSQAFTVTIKTTKPWPALSIFMGGTKGTFSLSSSKTAEHDCTNASQWEPS